jgi:hypothetical protein
MGKHLYYCKAIRREHPLAMVFTEAGTYLKMKREASFG